MKKLFSTRTSESAFSFAMFVLRVGAGSLMVLNHGLDKLTHFSQKSGAFADPFGIGSAASLSLSVFAEFFCAIFIILGLFTRLACIPLIINLSVALFFAHSGDFFGKGELSGLLLVVFATLLFAGPGRLSLDRFLVK
jgi:putative oxidoreductase